MEKIKLEGGSLVEPDGEEANIDDKINKSKKNETNLIKGLNEQEETLNRKYLWRNRTFYTGILALMVSRGWVHLQYFYDLF